MFSFLFALVRLDVFEEVTCNFLLVGHTGNEVDQLFSILAQEFKSDIKTVEDLKKKIEDAPIKPKPICRSLEYIFGWKEYVTPWLADPPLTNHSNYNSFQWQNEEGSVKFRAKKLPQESESVPRAGIRLLKEETLFYPVESAEFRTHDIPFDRIMKAVNILTSKLPLDEKMNIQSSWDRLRDSLEAVPRRRTMLRKMNLNELPKQVKKSIPITPPFLTASDDGNTISGDLYDENIDEGSLEEIIEDMDVCIYSDITAGRPWVGRVRQMLPGRKFTVQWFSRRSGRGQVFKAMNREDGSPFLSEVELDSIMFWEMSEDRREDSFKLASFWLETIRLEYEKLDK